MFAAFWRGGNPLRSVSAVHLARTRLFYAAVVLRLNSEPVRGHISPVAVTRAVAPIASTSRGWAVESSRMPASEVCGTARVAHGVPAMCDRVAHGHLGIDAVGDVAGPSLPFALLGDVVVRDCVKANFARL